MSDIELDLLKASVDKQVEIEITGGERLRVIVLFVFDEEAIPELFYDTIPPEMKLAPDGRKIGGYAVPLADIVSVRTISSE